MSILHHAERALIRPSGTFSHFTALNGRRPKWRIHPLRLLPCVFAWEKVADRPDEGTFRSDGPHGPVFTCMLSSLIISDDASTASKAEAGICLSWFRSPSGQRLSDVPWKNHGVPLSARTRP